MKMLLQSVSRQRLFRRFVLTTTILPAALAVQAFGDVNWNGSVPLNTGDPGGDIVHVLGNSTVTLTNTPPTTTITEASISFEPTLATETLTVNGATPGLTLRSLATIVAIANSKAITINGDADFAPGALSFGPTAGTSTVTGVSLIKNGGTGLLILDDPTNSLTGGTNKLIVLNGTMSIVGGGGVINPVSTLASAIQVGVAAGAGSPVLRIGSNGGATTFNNSIQSFQNNATIEHLTGNTDTLTGSLFQIKTATTLTVNVASGGLIVNGGISDTQSSALRGGTLRKLGNGTTLTLKGVTFLAGLNAAEGRLEVLGRLRLNSNPTIGANATLSLQNTSTVAGIANDLPTTISVPTGTLEASGPGAFGLATNLVSLTGGTLNLGLNANLPPSGLAAHLYNGGDGGAQAAFAGPQNPANTFTEYANYFAGRDAAPVAGDVVTTTASGGVTALSFGVVNGDAPMFAILDPSYTRTNNIVSRFNGRINITTAGTYTFATDSDDGSMLFLDGAKVVENNASQGHIRRTGTLDLTAGLHDIDIGYYEGGGANSIIVDYSGPDTADAQTTIPNSVLLAPLGFVPSVPPVQLIFLNPITVNPTNVSLTSVINTGSVSVPSVDVTAADKILTVNGQRLDIGVLKLTGGAGTYTLNANTLYGQVDAKSIIDNGNAVTLVNHGPGTLVIESGASPQLQNASSVVTVDIGPLGLVRGTGQGNPTGNATVNVNSHVLILSSKGGDQSFTLPSGLNVTSDISARAIGMGVAGTVATPIKTTLAGNIALNAGATLTLSSRNNYILAVGGVTGAANVSVPAGAVESSGPVNLSGAGQITIANASLKTLSSLAASNITVNSSTLTGTGLITTPGTLTVNTGTLTANGGANAGSIIVNDSTMTVSGPVTTGPGGISLTGGNNASRLNLNGGTIAGGPIAVQGGTLHAAAGLTTAATTATFTGLNAQGLKGRFIATGGGGQISRGDTQSGILTIQTGTNGLIEKVLNQPLNFPADADGTISTFFNGAPTGPGFAMGFFGNFKAPATGSFHLQTGLNDDDAGFWVDLDGDGVFEGGNAGGTPGANGNELIAWASCCGDGANQHPGDVTLVGGQSYLVAIAVEDGQGGSGLVGRITDTDHGGSVLIVDPNSPDQLGWWTYGLPNQVIVDAGAELDIQAINGAVSVSVNGHLEFDGSGSSTFDSLTIGPGGIVEVGAGPPPAPGAPGDELAGAAAVPEPGAFSLLLLGALGCLGRRPRASRD